MNRLTITLDDDLYAMARAHALNSKLSLSKAVADLLRRRAGGAVGGGSRHSLSGFPVSVGRGQPIGEAEIRRALEGEDAPALEMMGYSRKRNS